MKIVSPTGFPAGQSRQWTNALSEPRSVARAMFSGPARSRLLHIALFLAVVSAGALGTSFARQRDTGLAKRADALRDGFLNPPRAARPQVWWHWMSGNVTPEGARLDLEWMQRMGIGGVHAFAGGQLEPAVVPHPLPFMSEGWRAIYKQSVASARAAGMDVTIAGSPGWSETGGPWVVPADAMKKYTWSTMEVEGGRALHLMLPAPAAATGPFQALAPEAGLLGKSIPQPQFAGAGPVIAVPSLAAASPPARYSSPRASVEALGDAPSDLGRVVALPLASDDGAYIDITFDTPQTMRALTVAATPLPAIVIKASDDGQTFRTVRTCAQSGAEKPAAQQTLAFPETRARIFRIQFARPTLWRDLPDLPPGLSPPRAKSIAIRLLRLDSDPRIDHFEAKAGFQAIVDAGSVSLDARGPDPSDVIDLSAKMRSDGTLDWVPPAGRWTIIRFGWSLTGQTNGPAEPSATGLEVDKLDPAAVKRYTDALFSLYRDRAGIPLGANGINGLLTDSWEAGVQNWTPAILADFRRLRGYDPLPWLPVLTGRVVGDTARSEAFLFDFRQTLKDLVLSAHYAGLARVAHANGMTYYTEVQGDTPRAISDGLTAKAQADIPTGEFWYRPFATDPGQPSLVADLREAASAAHLYGKPLVAAEAMTVAAGRDPWAFSPAMLKPVADEIFALGVNRMLIHESHLQPFVDRRPGLMLGLFGQFFNRNDTWAGQARPWIDYLARTSWMLQQGRYVADVAYFYGESENLTQRYEHHDNDDVPTGYGFDYVDPTTLLNGLTIRNGRLVSPGGTDYRVLYIPDDITQISLPALRRIEALLRAGAVIAAPRPSRGLGMMSPDAAVARIASRLWPRQGQLFQQVGRGRLYSGVPLSRVLAAEGIAPDILAPAGAHVMSLHRRGDGADIYFVSNRDNEPVTQPIAFRVTGRVPEWWSAEDGKSRPLSYTIVGKETRVDVPLDPQGAGFVVFRRPAVSRSLRLPATQTVAMRPIAGPWQVTFEPGLGAPERALFVRLADWSKNEDPGIRYFSGTAHYHAKFTVQRDDLRSGRRFVLDLGDVREVASVTIDGRPIATAWHAPYRIVLHDRLSPGDHQIDVAVSNLWVNRLIGDRQPGAKPIAYAPQSPYRATDSLRPSGLLGPVRVLVETGPE